MNLHGRSLRDVIAPPAFHQGELCSQCPTPISDRSRSLLCKRCYAAKRQRERRAEEHRTNRIEWPLPNPAPIQRLCECGERATGCVQFFVAHRHGDIARTLWCCDACADWFEAEERPRGTIMRRLTWREAQALRNDSRRRAA